jgi:glycerophosphoryl diester phosphodiesterase
MKFKQEFFEFPDHPLLLAHRGSQILKKYPENTLPAFREGLQLGATGVEMDIRLSADRRIMVFHDRTLLRLMGIRKSLQSFSATQLRQFRFINQTAPEYIKMPTLGEVFEEFGDQIYYNIEVKRIFGSYTILIKELYELLQGFNLWKRVWISSFDPQVLWQWRRKYSDIPLALLFDKWGLWEKWLCQMSFIDILHPGIQLISKVKEIKKFQKKICFWTVNSRDELEKLKIPNLMGIISDNIPLIKEIYKSK